MIYKHLKKYYVSLFYMSILSKENKFNYSKIYKIISKNTDKLYIGSTTKDISERLKDHVYAFNYYSLGKTTDYMRSFEILKLGEYSIVLIRDVNVNNQRELFDEERVEIQSTENVVNKNIPNRSLKQYHQDNKETLNKKTNDYYHANKDRINENNNKKIECECGGKHTHANKLKHSKTQKHLNYLKNNNIDDEYQDI